MLKFSKHLLISIFIPTFVYCQFVPTDDSNLAYFEVIKNSFNNGNYEVIYKQLTSDVQSQLSLQLFEDTLQKIKDRAGTIDYWSYAAADPKVPAALVGFKNNLAAGIITWSYEGSKLKSFTMNDYSNPTFVEFMEKNPEKVAFTAISDDNILIDFNGAVPHDLMSVFKITVAIEFSRQVSQGIIDPNLWIPLTDLNKFYIEELDSAHAQFLQLWGQMGLIVENKVQLIEIANGMIALSSNTNTEFLQGYLTMDAIDKTVKDIKLDQTTTYYLNSMFLVYLNKNDLSREDYIKQIKSYTADYVHQQSNQIHAILVQGGQEAKDLLKRGKELLDGEVLGIQAQIFTKSTTNGYARIMNNLNNEELFDSKFYESFYPLIGYVSLKNPALVKIYKHTGIKGGSSAFPDDTECVLSIAQFYELYQPFPYRRTSYALFTQDLNYNTEYVPLIVQFNHFTALLGLNGHYLNAIAQQLGQTKQI